jgi:hypothetical protein
MRRIFYIYVVFRKSGVPCYIGKGKGNRWKNHLSKSHNRHLRRIVAKEGNIPIVVIRSGLTETEAFEIEIALIKAIGRQIHGGPLVNQTDGGEGVSGFKMPPSALKKLSARMTGKKVRLGYKTSDETKAKQRSLKLDVPLTPEHRKALSDSAPYRGLKRPPEVGAAVSAGKKGKSPREYTWSPEARARQKERFADPELREKISAGTKLANSRPEVAAYYESKRLKMTDEERLTHQREINRKKSRAYRGRQFRALWENAPIFVSPFSQWGDGASAGLF